MLLVLARLRGRETEAAGVEAAAGQRRRKLGIRRGRGERSDAVFHADRTPAGRRQAVVSAESSDERRGGKECVSKCRSRWPPHHPIQNLEYHTPENND